MSRLYGQVGCILTGRPESSSNTQQSVETSSKTRSQQTYSPTVSSPGGPVCQCHERLPPGSHSQSTALRFPGRHCRHPPVEKHVPDGHPFARNEVIAGSALLASWAPGPWRSGSSPLAVSASQVKPGGRWFAIVDASQALKVDRLAARRALTVSLACLGNFLTGPIPRYHSPMYRGNEGTRAFLCDYEVEPPPCRAKASQKSLAWF